jgi:type II secretory pathway component GspD/PulD (secretin)
MRASKHGCMLYAALAVLALGGPPAGAGETAVAAGAAAQEPGAAAPGTEAPVMSFVFRDTSIIELLEMIARKERINIVVGRGVAGNVAVNLYNMTSRQAIFAIAEAGGYAVTVRENGYFVGDPKAAPAAAAAAGGLEVRSLRVQYSDPKQVAEILARHVSPGGSVTVLEQRKMLVVEDTPAGLLRIEKLLREIDAQPRQIMIEAKILEISLERSENFGIDWSKVFSADGINRIGTAGLAPRAAGGLAFSFINHNVELFLSALSAKGRVRTLATPKLLTLENQEAITNIGDKLGYRLTTTINNVTAESIQFLETGVILRVIPSVDASGKILLKIRPEVSSGSVSGGIPSKKTTEVSTQLVAADGQAVLIAGLIKTTSNYRRTGVPLLADVPVLGRLFSGTDDSSVSSETIVMITPRIVGAGASETDPASLATVENAAAALRTQAQGTERIIDSLK